MAPAVALACCSMRFSFLVSSAALALIPAARADTGSPEQSTAASPTEEMIIYGEQEIARRRGEVVQNLRHLGYRELRRRDGKTVFAPKVPYRPTVVLDDDAWMQVKRTPVRIDPPGASNWRYLWCLPPFTITAACIQVGGQVIGKRKLAPFKEDVVRATQFEMRAWQRAVVANAMAKRLNQELPDMLDATWHTGQPLGDDGPFIESPENRRELILDFWASRSCVAEGQQVRELVATFIQAEIQTGPDPASAEEIRVANNAQRCPEAKPIPIP